MKTSDVKCNREYDYKGEKVTVLHRIYGDETKSKNMQSGQLFTGYKREQKRFELSNGKIVFANSLKTLGGKQMSNNSPADQNSTGSYTFNPNERSWGDLPEEHRLKWTDSDMQEFAEWCAINEWEYLKERKMWYNNFTEYFDGLKTTAQLLQEFKAWKEATNEY
jgi:predicted O-linked N-acetylglucosamine transferase (SPINDLY family)